MGFLVFFIQLLHRPIKKDNNFRLGLNNYNNKRKKAGWYSLIDEVEEEHKRDITE
jgi:hypothetical protein